MRKNVVTIRIPPLELDILGNKIQINTQPLSSVGEYQVSEKEAQTLRLVMLLLSRLSQVKSP